MTFLISKLHFEKKLPLNSGNKIQSLQTLRRRRIVYQPDYAMFFDMHTMQACPDTGHAFNGEEFALSLKEANVDFVGFHAKCNQGFCYFNTKIGIRHPALPENKDLFGEVVKNCAKHNIKVSAYFNCGLSNEDGIKHPEWCRIGIKGELFHPEIYQIGWVSPYIRTLCPNSPWRDYLLALIREVRDSYEVVGFLFDSFNTFPCVCPHCIKKMHSLGIDHTDPEAVHNFAAASVKALARDISDMLQVKKGKYLVYFLGLSVNDNVEMGSYLECECLPGNPAWGYDYLPLMARYYRTKTDHPILNMTGRFNNWGDFGSLRTEKALEYDLLFGLANGMRPNIGDHLLPSGKLLKAVFERVGSVYGRIKKLDPWMKGAVNKRELAVLVGGNVKKTPALTGVTRMLSELSVQFDIIDRENDFSPYKVLLLPDDVLLDDSLAEKITVFVKNRGRIIATARSGLDRNNKGFLLEDLWGCTWHGELPWDPAYFTLCGQYRSQVSQIPLAACSKGCAVQALKTENVCGKVVRPYYNRHWDGVHSHFYTPPAEETQDPFLILSENCAYCAFPLCEAYHEQASPDLRSVLKIMLSHVLEKQLLRLENFPSFGRAFVAEKEGCDLVHLLAYVPELRGKSLVLEDSIALTNVKVCLDHAGKKIQQIYLPPGKTPLEWKETPDGTQFVIPRMDGYAMAVVEYEVSGKTQ